MDRIEKAEEQIAHLVRAVEDLSDVVARQEAEIERLSRRLGGLLERESGRANEPDGIPHADQRPPHW